MDPNNVNGMIHVGINGSPYMMLSQNQMVQQQYQIQLQQQMLAQSAYQEVRNNGSFLGGLKYGLEQINGQNSPISLAVTEKPILKLLFECLLWQPIK